MLENQWSKIKRFKNERLLKMDIFLCIGQNIFNSKCNELNKCEDGMSFPNPRLMQNWLSIFHLLQDGIGFGGKLAIFFG